MSVADELLRDVVAHPDDDTPRLVCADWLDEHGQAARAEFIRVQCRLAALPERHPERAALRAREAELHASHSKAWCRGLPQWVWGHCQFRRGFVDRVEATLAQFLKGAAKLRRLAPVREVRIRDADQGLEVLGSPHLASLTELHLGSTGIGDEGATALASSPSLTGLSALTLGNEGIGPEGTAALASSPNLANLTVLDLGSNVRVGDEGAIALAGSPHLANLTVLRLAHAGIGPAGATPLASSPHLRKLSVLDLGLNSIGDAAARALAASPNLANVSRLRLFGCHLGQDVQRELLARFGDVVEL
jgi:uncharacterized protein (TIGR02996 family)